MNFNVHDMTTEEKLQTMELLWDDLCRNIPQFPSPAWHEQILQERERNLRRIAPIFSSSSSDIWAQRQQFIERCGEFSIDFDAPSRGLF